MSSTYGWLYGKAVNPATRCGGKEGISGRIQTWNGGLDFSLDPEGNLILKTDGDIKIVTLRHKDTLMIDDDFIAKKMVEVL